MGSIIKHEQDFVNKLHAGHANDQVATWGSDCGTPTSDFSGVSYDCRGGTAPSQILKSLKALNAIRTSELWYILTDGEIWSYDVEVLSKLAMDAGVLNVPVVFVILGHKTTSPSSLNVSVGISFFANAPDVLVLFKQVSDGSIYVLAGKGYFAHLTSRTDQASPDLSTWDNVKKLSGESEFLSLCRKRNLEIPSAESRPTSLSGIIRLGEQWERENDGGVVDVDSLLTTGGLLGDIDLEQLLSDEALNNLSVACKTRGRIQDLRALLLNQKVEEINIKLEDVSGASDIVRQLSNTDLDQANSQVLQQKLREAHTNNRQHYQNATKNLKESGLEQATRKRNRLVNHALEQLAEVERSTYTADILTRRSNRARRADTVAAGGEISISSLDLDTPTAFRGECPVCCGENEVMSLAIKTGSDGPANTDNFALDFPLAAGQFESNKDLISSQSICFQCALACEGQSLYREDLAAILPTLDYEGSNKKYIQEQLYLALTGGLRTGASGVSQLFLTILDRTLREKEWAGAGLGASEDPEVAPRQAMFRWLLSNMLERTMCRETFNEQGKWVSYREALIWAAKDFYCQGVDSWIVGYPAAGFMQLVRFAQQLDAFDTRTVCDLRLAKLIHSVTSFYLALLLKNGGGRRDTWKQPLLELVYAEFNTDMIPVDKFGSSSLVHSTTTFWNRLATFLVDDTELLANWELEDQERAMRRIQLIIFWLVYHQRDHTRAKTFFERLRAQQPLSHTVLDASGATISPSVSDPILLSIFRGKAADQSFHARHTGIAPFATSFGASVLHCCFEACSELFIPLDQLPSIDENWTVKQLDALRQARANHLVKAFAVDDRFRHETQTGLPVPTMSPAPPASTHVNLHISIARAWAQLSKEERKRIAAASAREDATMNFIHSVRETICAARRGDIFTSRLDDDVRNALPSFFEALGVALKAQGKGEGVGVEEYEYNWDENKLEAKAKYEIRLALG